MAITPWGAATEVAHEVSSTVVSLLTVIDYVAKQFRDNIPTIQDEVVVEVVGQPGASKQELYFLAMAAANGIVRRIQPLLQLNPFLPPSAASLMIEYDAADHWVRCSLTYRSAAIRSLGTRVESLLPGIDSAILDPLITAFSFVVPGGLFAAAIAGAIPDPGFFNNSAVYRGPQCAVVGAALDFVDPVLPGIPGPLFGAPTLPWRGKTILTACPTVADPRPIPAITDAPPPTRPLITPGPLIPSPNPKPSGDNRSRGSVVGPSTDGASDGCCPKTLLLVELVSAALTNPGGNAFETWTPPIVGPGAGAGTPVGG